MRDDDPISNASTNPHFNDVVETRIARRDFLAGSAAVGGSATLGGIGALLSAVPAAVQAHRREPLLGFQGVPVSSADAVSVPPGYTARVLVAWGDPLSDGPAFKPDASNSAAEQAQQWGMHNDGLVYFPIRGSRRGLLVQNHEYTDDGLLFTDGTANWTAEKTDKALNAHGVSVIEVRARRAGEHDDAEDDSDDDRLRRGRPPRVWEVVRPSRYARRITAQTPIRISGPAAGDARLRTSADPTGTQVRGTINNCAMGYTPWGTYLACEENFNGYFFRTLSPDNRSVLEKRYGIAPFGNPGARCSFSRRCSR
jgi:uncharacterized protein